MADPQRIKADYFVEHHAVTPLWSDRSKAWLAQWFSDNGFARGYGSNPANWNGLINPFTGGRSYAQAHAVGQRVDGSTPDATDAERAAGYRIFWIVKDPYGVITYGAGNWEINRRAINVENLGNYLDYPLRDGDCRVHADFWRPRDKQLGGATAVVGHKEVSSSATACPARIMESRDTIVNYINNPPQPPKPTKPTWVAMDVPRAMKVGASGTNLINVITGAVIKNYKAGEQINDLNQKTIWNGKTYVRTAYSSTNQIDNGFDVATLTEIPVITTKEETRQEPIPFTSETIEDPTLPYGETKITQVGVNGIKTIVYTVTYTNGVETSRVIKSQSVTTQPVSQVTAIGTKPDVTPAPIPEPGDDALGWLKSLWEWVKSILKSFTFKG
jgi:hypothetical protein